MKKRINFFWFLLLFTGSFSLFSKQDSDNGHKTQKFVLNNGLTVVAKKINGHPLVAMKLLVKTGSAGEKEYSGTGISHFLEHLTFKGTEKFPPGEIARSIKLLGGTINAFTTYDYISFSIVVPKENSEKALEILIDSIFNPIFREEDFKNEKQVILNEMLIEKDEPQKRVFRLFWQNFYRIHPYRHPIIGYPELFSKLTLEEVKDFYRRNYIPNNMIISLTGGFEEEFLQKISNLLSSKERKKEIEKVNITEPLLISKILYEEDYPSELMYLIIGFPGIEFNHQDLFALDLLATILGEGNSSRLYKSLKVKKNLVYSISCFNHTPKDKGIFGIYVIGEYKNKEKIIKEIIEEIRKIKRFAIPYREIVRAKNILTYNFYLGHEKVEEQAHQLAIGEFYTGNPDFYPYYLEKIKKVSSKDLRRVAQKYLKEDRLAIVSLKPNKAKEESNIKKFEKYKNEAEITKITLENGLTILINEDHTLPISSINAIFLGGLRIEPEGKDGISNLLAKLLGKGMKNKSEDEINRLIEEKGGSLNTFSGTNSLGISLNLISKNTLWGIRFLSQLIKKANFSENLLQKEKTQILAEIKERDNFPVRYAVKILKNKLFPNHPYGRDILGEKETIEKISLEDIYRFYHKVINPKNCVISVIGDFDKEMVIKEVKKTFSKWKEGKNFLSLDINKAPPIENPLFYQEEIAKRQAIIAIGFHTISLYNPKRFVFEVLEEILSGQGNRLFESIREKRGLVYWVDAYNVNGLDTGYFLFLAGTDIKNLEQVKKLIFEEIDNLKREDFSNEEIERAKAYLIGKQKRGLQTKHNFSLIVSLDELYGLGFNYYKLYEKNINSVSKEELKEVAENYFKENNYIVVELLPRE